MQTTMAEDSSTDPSSEEETNKEPIQSSPWRQQIFRAVNQLDNENAKIRKVNNQVVGENKRLKEENNQLRQELETVRQDMQSCLKREHSLKIDNNNLREKFGNLEQRYRQENSDILTENNRLREENTALKKEMENLKNELNQNKAEMNRLLREIEALKQQLQRAATRVVGNRDVELMHEAEQLKIEKRDLESGKVELSKINTKLRNELKNFDNILKEKESEMKNEKRRHSVLTKEFNSLLEENTHLKLQLRRRLSGASLIPEPQSPDDYSQEVTYIEKSKRSPKQSKMRIGPLRDSSNTSPTELGQPSRDRTSLSREATFISNDGSNGSRGKSSGQRDAKKLQTQRPPTVGRDGGDSPDSFPPLTASRSSKGKWKP